MMNNDQHNYERKLMVQYLERNVRSSVDERMHIEQYLNQTVQADRDAVRWLFLEFELLAVAFYIFGCDDVVDKIAGSREFIQKYLFSDSDLVLRDTPGLSARDDIEQHVMWNQLYRTLYVHLFGLKVADLKAAFDVSKNDARKLFMTVQGDQTMVTKIRSIAIRARMKRYGSKAVIDSFQDAWKCWEKWRNGVAGC
jgi:hypothetical protein